MAEYFHQTHTFEPVCNEQSRILILGTFPSVKSRETDFYYGHPQNRFWKLLARLLEEPIPQSIEEKKEMLLRRKIAIWDVIASCDIIGSSDSSIKNVVPNDIRTVLQKSPIQEIYANGNTAAKLYRRYVKETIGMEITTLPSTSPANAAYSPDKLYDTWNVITKHIL